MKNTPWMVQRLLFFPMSNEPSVGRWQFGGLFFFLLVLLLAQMFSLPSSLREIPYSEFKQLLRSGQVADLQLSPTAIQGQLLSNDAEPSTDPSPSAPTTPQRFSTNRPEILDPALLRAGRFDRHVVLDRPDVKGREAILRVHAKNVNLAPEVDLGTIAARTPGFVGADLANIVNEAALLAARKDQEAVLMADFDEAVDRVIAGVEKKTRVINPREKAIIAHHEIGHALTAELLPHVDPVRKVSIIPRGVAALGYTQQLPTEDRYLMTRAELEDRLCVLLGGRVAEEIMFGDVSTGAQDDLQKATDIARSMVTEYGMSERLGVRAFEKERRGLVLDTPWATRRDYSEEKAAEIDREVEEVIERAHHQVQELLTAKKPLLAELAQRLLEREVLEGEELRRIIAAASETTRVEKALVSQH